MNVVLCRQRQKQSETSDPDQAFKPAQWVELKMPKVVRLICIKRLQFTKCNSLVFHLVKSIYIYTQVTIKKHIFN